MLTLTLEIDGKSIRRFEIINDGTGSENLGHYNVREIRFTPRSGLALSYPNAQFRIERFGRLFGPLYLAKRVLGEFLTLYPADCGHETKN